MGHFLEMEIMPHLHRWRKVKLKGKEMQKIQTINIEVRYLFHPPTNKAIGQSYGVGPIYSARS